MRQSCASCSRAPLRSASGARLAPLCLVTARLFLAVAALRMARPGSDPRGHPSRRIPRQIVWLAEPGPGGGGGGGNERPEPPKPAEVASPKKEEISVPALKPEPTPEPTPEEVPLESLNIPALTMAAATETTIGVLDSGDASSQSTGSGRGTGAGSGEGSGLGQGSGGGTGGGVYRPGSGVINPRILREIKPQYTADAMRAKVQGTVLLECVVLAGRHRLDALTSCGRSTRRSVSIRRRSRPPSSGGSSQGPDSASPSRSWSRSSSPSPCARAVCVSP